MKEVNYCSCGSYDEWETCDSIGALIDPNLKWDGHYLCMNCGSIENMAKKNNYYTIELNHMDGGGYNIYGWGVYERGSILAGQQRKSFMNSYHTVDDALKDYPDANVSEGIVPTHNTFDHLPDYEMSAYEEEQYWDPVNLEEGS